MKAKSHLTLSFSMNLLDAFGLILAEHVHHLLDFVQVVRVKESCLEPRASARQHGLGWQG